MRERRLLHSVFEEQAARTPHLPAVEHDGAVLDYASLDRRANALAHHLIELGVATETIVAVLLERSIDLVVAILAILKAGGAYLPLDPDAPRERIGSILDAARVPLVLTHNACHLRLPHHPARRVVLTNRLDADRHPQNSPAAPVLPHNLCYVIYTSGTTGTPRGAMIEHRGAVNTILHVADVYRVSEGGRFLQFANVTFDAFVDELFPALAVGAALVIPSREILQDLAKLERFIREERITNATLTPALLKHMSFEGCEHIAVLVSAGEACPPTLAQRLVREVPRFVNGYGPTECSVCATNYVVPPDVGGIVPIGTTLPGVEIHICDAQMNEAPRGVEGEIYIGGVGVGRGYLHDEAATRESFVPSPFSGGGMLFKTGDAGVVLPDGNLHFLGRIVEQIKIRGLRVDPREIEGHVLRMEGVVDCLVVNVEDERSGANLVCYYVSAQRVTPGAVRQRLKEALPAYMAPNHIIELPELPRTPHGKVDRAALPPPRPSGGAAPAGAGEEALTSTERVVADIWRSVLGVEHVGAKDDWYDLGGDSLLAMRAISLINARLGVDLDVMTLIEHSTLDALSARVSESGVVDVSAQRIPLTEPDAEHPLSSAQAMFWFLYHMEPSSPLYNITTAISIDGPLDVDRLRHALQAVVARHEALRTNFREGSRGPIQVIRGAGSIELEIQEGGGPPAPDDPLLGAFSLEDATLVRARLVRRSPTSSTLFLAMHHIVCDASSAEILHRDLAAAYESREALPRSRELQYRDFAAWEQERVAHDLSAESRFWAEYLGGAPHEIPLPADLSRKGASRFRGATIHVSLPASLAAALKRLGDRCDSVSYVTLFGVFNLLLHRLSGEEDIVVGTPVSTRDLPELDRVVGPFINVLPIRSTMIAGEPCEQFLLRQRTNILTCLRHKGLPFDQIVAAVNPTRDDSGSPLFNVMFDYAVAAPQISAGSLVFTQEVCPNNTSKFDLSVSALHRPDSIDLAVEYDSALFSEAAVRLMVSRFIELVRSVTAEPERAASAVDIISPEERRTILERFNDTASPLPERTFIEVFAEQARRSADRVAVACGRDTCSYRELDERSSALARRLRASGVGPDRLVGILMERSVEMIVAIVATWKALGAYVPLDVEHPQERLDELLRQADPTVLLTTARRSALARLCPERVLALDDPEVFEVAPGDEPLPGPGSSSDLAYVLFTSGSTGTPKGVMIEQLGFMNHLVSMVRHVGLSAGSVIAQNASHCFDVSVWQMVCALLEGGRVEIFLNDETHDLEAFISLMRSRRVEVLEVVPSYLGAMLDHLEQEGADAALPDLRVLLVTGEVTSTALIRRWFARFPRVRVINAYGPAEASDDVTLHALEGLPEDAASALPIGWPIENVRIHVVDPYLNLCPIGIKGEICVSGIAVGRGYLGDEERTRQVFIEDPFAAEPGVRLYRTGDIGRWRPDGVLEFFGRRDNQLKVRGFRVELGEIEAQLDRHPGIKGAAVIDLVPEGRSPVLAACYCSDGPIAVSELREHLAARVPSYMIPQHFFHLAELPRTRTGKLDRRALRRMLSGPAPASEAAGGRTEAEQVLYEAWVEALGGRGLEAAPLSLDDNFFERGGDSLSCIRIVSRVRQRGYRISVRSMFRYQTIRDLARTLEQGRPPARTAPDLREGEDAPLTPVQAEFFDRYGHQAHYNQAVVISGLDVDAGALEAAVGELVRRHDALSMSFVDEGEGVRQRRGALAEGIFEVHDLRGRPGAEALASELASRLQRGFHLALGPLFRAALFLSDERSELLLAAHHLVVDAVSWRVMILELDELYRARRDGRAASLPPAGATYREWAERLHAFANGSRASAWLAHFRELQATHAAAREALPRPRGAAAGRDLITSALPRAQELRRFLHRRPGIHGAAVVLAALARALRAELAAPALEVGIETHGRADLFEDVDIAGTVGWFTATCAVLLEDPGAAPPDLEVRKIQKELDGIAERAIVFTALRRLRVAEDVAPLKAWPDPAIVFNYLGELIGGDEVDVLRGARIVREGVTDPALCAPELLEIDVAIEGDALVVDIRFRPDAFPRCAVSQLLERLDAELRSLLARGEAGGARAEVEDVFPLSPMQAGLLFHSLIDEDARRYSQQLALETSGPLHPDVLAGAWRAVVAQSPVLRSTVDWEGHEPLNIVRASMEGSMSLVDLRDRADADQAIDDLMLRDLQSGFDLAAGPLIRCTLFRSAGDRYTLLFSYHHILLDGASVPLLLEDLRAAYDALLAGAQPRGASRPPFRLHVMRLLERNSAPAHSFWREYLRGCDVAPTLGLSAQALAAAGLSSGSCERTLDEQLSSGLGGLSVRHRVTLNTLLRTAWGLALGRVSGRSDVLLGSVAMGRSPDVPGSERIIGLMINTIPIRVRWTPQDTLADVVHRAQLEWLDMRDFEHTPLNEIKRLVDCPREGDPFDTLFTYAGDELFQGSDAELFGCRWSVYRARELTNYAIAIDLTLRGDRIHVKLTHPASAAIAAIAPRLLEVYIEILRAFLEDASVAVDTALSRLSPGALPADGSAPRPGAPQPEQRAPSARAREEVKRDVLAAWQYVFGRSDIPERASFFELGGDSLTCIRLVSRLKHLGYRASLKLVFAHETVDALAEVLSFGAEKGDADTSLRAVPAGVASRAHACHGSRVSAVLPLSHVQRAIVARYHRGDDGGLYHDQSMLEYSGRIDHDAFRAAWRHVVQETPMLRTVFLHDEEMPVQVVLDAHPPEVSVVDWSSLPRSEQDLRLAEARAEDLSRGFNLAEGPLLRLGLFRLGPEAHVVLMSFPALIVDGWCFAFVLGDFYAAYEALIRGEAPAAASRSGYEAYLAWLARQDRTAAERFWRERLAGVDLRPAIKRDRSKAPLAEARIAITRIELDEQATARLRAWAARHRVTVSTVVQVAWGQLLQAVAGRSDVIFGVTVSGRPEDLAGAEEMVGLFFNDLPLRVDLDPTRPPGDLARSVQQSFAEMRRYEFLSTADIKAAAGIPEEEELFQSLIVFENYPKEREAELRSLHNEHLRNVGAWRREASDIDLTVYVEATSRISVEIRYRSDVFDGATVQDLLRSYEHHLSRFAADAPTDA